MERSELQDMKAWKAARKLMASIYRVTDAGDFNEDADLRQQMRRASTALMADVAQLFDASSKLDSARSVRTARYSVNRLQSQLYVAAERYYIEPETFDDLNDSADQLKEEIVEYFQSRS